MIGKFFHIPKSKRFSITPRFHDPEQDERDDRERRIKEELGIVDEAKNKDKPYRPSIKGQFRNPDGWQAKSSESERRSQNQRLFWIIIVLAFVLFLFFYY